MKSTFVKIICVVLALAVSGVGIALLIKTGSAADEAVSVSEISGGKIEPGTFVRIDECSVIAPYMYTDNDGTFILHCLVSFPDAEGDMCIASLSVSKEDGVYDFIERYINDESAGVGTYAVRGYFSAVSVGDMAQRLQNYYAAGLDRYAELFAEGSKLNYNGNTLDSGVDLRFMGESENAFLKSVAPKTAFYRAAGISVTAAGALCTVFAVAVIIFEHRNRKYVI